MGLNITAYAVIISFLIGSLGSGGLVWHYRDLRDAARQEKVMEHVITVTKVLQGKADAAEANQVQVQKQLEVKYETIEKSVPVYIHDINPTVSNNLVSVLNNAARPDLPSSPAISPDTPSTVTASLVAANIVHNYSICQANSEELKGWQTWWDSVKDIK